MNPPTLHDYFRTIGSRGGKVKSLKKRIAAFNREERKRQLNQPLLHAEAAYGKMNGATAEVPGDGG